MKKKQFFWSAFTCFFAQKADCNARKMPPTKKNSSPTDVFNGLKYCVLHKINKNKKILSCKVFKKYVHLHLSIVSINWSRNLTQAYDYGNK
jgi:hypothetical protein